MTCFIHIYKIPYNRHLGFYCIKHSYSIKARPQKHLLGAKKETRNSFLYGKCRRMHHMQDRWQRFRAAVRKFKETKKRASYARWRLAASASTRQITTKIIFDTTEKDNPKQSAPGTPAGTPGPGKLYRLHPPPPRSAILLRARLGVLIIQLYWQRS